MKSQFRTASALLRHTWLIDESFADAHQPLINQYLQGKYPQQEGAADGVVSPIIGYAIAASAIEGRHNGNADRFALDDPEMPDNSVLVVEIKGAMFKDGFCGSAGSLDYARIINKSYTNDKIIGQVIVFDSPGGQISGTPTLADAIADPRKPTVSLVLEGCMASAAYWTGSQANHILASQQTDQIGSIGVMVRLQNTTEADKMAGVQTITVYSSRSPQKNKPYTDALAGQPKTLQAELDEIADLFHAAVKQGRGNRLKVAKKGDDDVFLGGMFSAGKAIALGLIDGYGNLDTALAKVVELSKLSPEQRAVPAYAHNKDSDKTPEQLETEDEIEDEIEEETEEEIGVKPKPLAGNTSDPQPTPNPSTMLGFVRLAALAAVQGMIAADVTAEQISAINTELAAGGYPVAAINAKQLEETQALQAQLNTANASFGTLQTTATAAAEEVVRLTGEVARLGKQPGALGTTVAKEEEKIDTTGEAVISETDAELRRMKGQ